MAIRKDPMPPMRPIEEKVVKVLLELVEMWGVSAGYVGDGARTSAHDVKGCGSCEGFFWDGATSSMDYVVSSILI